MLQPIALASATDVAPVLTAPGWGGVGAVGALVYGAWLVGSMLMWPLVRAATPHLPDAGWGFARLMAVVAPAWLAWLAGSTGTPAAWLLHGWGTWVLLLAVSAITIQRDAPALTALLRNRWRAMAALEAGFLAIFILLVVVRAQVPGITFEVGHHAGEKFTDMALFQSALRTQAFPPEHPWLSGFPLNYYYFGQWMWAYPAGLLGLPPAVGYNMALVGVFALVWVLGASAVLLATRSPLWAWVAGTFLVLLGPASTWAAFLRFNEGQSWGEALAAFTSSHYFWAESRSVAHGITEFPIFSMILGDLHAHVCGLPLLMGWMVWMLQWPWLMPMTPATAKPRVLRGGIDLDASPAPMSDPRELPELPEPLQPQRHIPWPAVGLAALLLGAMSATNTWDVISAGLLAAAVGAVAWRQRMHRMPAGLTAQWLALGAAAGLAGIAVLFGPFWRHFQAPVMMPPQEASWLRLFTPFEFLPAIYRTASGEFLGFFGLWLGVLLVAAAPVLADCLRWPAGGFTAETLWKLSARLALGLTALLWLAMVLRRDDPIAQGVLAQPGFVPAAMLACVAALLLLPMRGAPTPGRIARRGLVAGAFLAMVLPDIVYLDDVFGGEYERINTIFKIWYAAWPMLTLGAIISMAMAMRRLRPRLGAPATAALTALVLVVIMAAGGLYSLSAVRTRVATAPERSLMPDLPTLDGWAFAGMLSPMRRDDYRAIRHVQASLPTRLRLRLIEAPDGNYGFAARFASNLGLPSFLGWPQHVTSWSATPMHHEVERRTQFIINFYSAMNAGERRAFLEETGIRMVVAGSTEQSLFGRYVLDDLRESLPEGWREVAFGSCSLFVHPEVAGMLEGAHASGDPMP